MLEKDLLNEYELSLVEFSSEQWEGQGFIDLKTRTVYINQDLDEIERKKILLHEIGHLNHYSSLYETAPLLCENQADCFMIEHLIAEEVAEYGIEAFNVTNFMKRHKMKTMREEALIEKELRKIS